MSRTIFSVVLVAAIAFTAWNTNRIHKSNNTAFLQSTLSEMNESVAKTFAAETISLVQNSRFALPILLEPEFDDSLKATLLTQLFAENQQLESLKLFRGSAKGWELSATWNRQNKGLATSPAEIDYPGEEPSKVLNVETWQMTPSVEGQGRIAVSFPFGQLPKGSPHRFEYLAQITTRTQLFQGKAGMLSSIAKTDGDLLMNGQTNSADKVSPPKVSPPYRVQLMTATASKSSSGAFRFSDPTTGQQKLAHFTKLSLGEFYAVTEIDEASAQSATGAVQIQTLALMGCVIALMLALFSGGRRPASATSVPSVEPIQPAQTIILDQEILAAGESKLSQAAEPAVPAHSAVKRPPPPPKLGAKLESPRPPPPKTLAKKTLPFVAPTRVKAKPFFKPKVAMKMPAKLGLKKIG